MCNVHISTIVSSLKFFTEAYLDFNTWILELTGAVNCYNQTEFSAKIFEKPNKRVKCQSWYIFSLSNQMSLFFGKTNMSLMKDVEELKSCLIHSKDSVIKLLEVKIEQSHLPPDGNTQISPNQVVSMQQFVEQFSSLKEDLTKETYDVIENKTDCELVTTSGTNSHKKEALYSSLLNYSNTESLTPSAPTHLYYTVILQIYIICTTFS